ncbi:MAG: hypothetical protein HC827_08045 [Cyanobacteria bacterium RM1_2_2]|nr:hypothetical protein [Cyanobacteria bacterium RM1_2_2]
MSSRHPYNAVFPVILVASTVFSILSLPFFLYRLQPEATSPSLQQDFQPILESQNRDVTIRYIGAALVLSVITGIGTVELQRRRQPRPALANQPSVKPDQNLVGWFLAQTPELLSPEPFIDSALEEQDELAETMTASAAEVGLWVGDSEYAEDIQGDFAPSQPAGLMTELDELNQDYSTCRIWVQPLQRRLFAIQVEEQFYSFFRLLPSKEAARQTALQLSESLHHTVITPVEQEFAVWIWQPEAELETELEVQPS